MKKIRENIGQTNDKYMLPFFWQHGETKEVLCEYVEKIKKSGCDAFCIEARPHPEFTEAGWWRDVSLLIAEAKKREMKIWILDDSHFPTGYANGKIKEEYPMYRKRFLKLHQLDFCGPVKDACAMVSYAFTGKEDKLVGVVLAKKTGDDLVDTSTLRVITEGVKDNKTVTFDLLEGVWRVMTLVSTYEGGEEQTKDYLNPLEKEAVDVLLDSVYKLHYERFSEEFGKTIAGFFSDEPRFGNIHGAMGSIGRCEMVLPWREGLESLLSDELEINTVHLLPLLFVGEGEVAHQIRYAYMNLVSRLYSENFSGRIGNWCREHGVSYIGHTIEDNNAHARLGYGAGHFFRAMEGQDMAGIDVVLHQLLPGMDLGYYKSMTSSGWDGEFFHYCLGKLGSSLAHLDEKKAGRAMCEIFGAYGWGEGTKLMKWLSDHMLVRGINYFVPHAFNPGEYPDRDCPPHFYAHGRNPQFQEFGILMEYMNRMSHLLSGGIHSAPVALCYHGEAEWSGEYMLMQKPAAVLTRNQIDFDIVPIDAVKEASVIEGKMSIGREKFSALVIPYGEAFPEQFLRKLVQLSKEGVLILFIEKLPARCSEKKGEPILFHELEENVKVCALSDLAKTLIIYEIPEIRVTEYQPYLRYYHYKQEDGDIYFFTNEHPSQSIFTEITLPQKGSCLRYDAMENKIFHVDSKETKGGMVLSLKLEALESSVIFFAKKDISNIYSEGAVLQGKSLPIAKPMQVSLIRSEHYPKPERVFEMTEPKPLQKIEGAEDFTGIIKYDIVTELSKEALSGVLKITGITESVRVWVNGVFAGMKIAPPYSFYDIKDLWVEGENKITLEVTTTLVREHYDWLSQWMLIEPTGWSGELYLLQENENKVEEIK